MAADYQYTFKGLTLGAGTSLLTEKVTGVLGLPPIVGEDPDQVGRHGALPGRMRYAKRTIAMDVKGLYAPGSASVEAALATFTRNIQMPRLRKPRVLDALTIKRPGQDERYVMARVSRRDIDSTYVLASGRLEASIEFVAPDPIWYSTANPYGSVALGNAVLTNSTIVSNFGDFPDGVYPVVTFTGPMRNPRLMNDTDDDLTFKMDMDILATDKVVVDFLNMTVVHSTIPGVFIADRFDAVRNDSQWWTLIPGNNTIVATRDGAALTGAGAAVTVQWRHGWM